MTNVLVLILSVILAERIRHATNNCNTSLEEGGGEVDICSDCRNSSACWRMYFSGISAPGDGFCFLDLGDVAATDLRFRPLGGIFVWWRKILEAVSEFGIKLLPNMSWDWLTSPDFPVSPAIGSKSSFHRKFQEITIL